MPCTLDANSADLPPTTQIWRYLDLWQFIDLLATRSLWFARADTLGDPFEFSFLLTPARTEEIRRQSAELARNLPALAEAR